MGKKDQTICGCVGMWEGMETFGKDFPAERNKLENVCAGEAAGPEAPGAQRGGGAGQNAATAQATGAQCRGARGWQRAGSWAGDDTD